MILTVLIIIATFKASDGASSYCTMSTKVDPELILTHQEKVVLDKFKASVYPRGSKVALLKPIITNDLYLTRWIRAKNLDLKLAVDDFTQLLDFIRNNRIEGINNEDWSDMYEDFPYHLDVTDRCGRPVAYINGPDGWIIRDAILQGKRSRLMRYTYKLFFDIINKIMEAGKEQRNVTQALFVFNIDDFTIVDHSCAACIQTYLTLMDVYEKYIPGFFKEIIIINAPQAYLIMLEIIRPAMSPHTRKIWKVFGRNKDQWKHYLNFRIDLNRMPYDFGGPLQE